MMELKSNLKLTFHGVVRSYSQVFFSDSILFGVLLMVVSFIDFYAGMAGLIAVFATCITGSMLGLDRNQMAVGTYGFNSFLVGISIGVWFQPGVLLYIIIALASVLTLLISVSVRGVFIKYGLPFLSIPFLLGAWIMMLATRELSFLGISERGIFTLNELYVVGGKPMVHLYEWWNQIEFARPVKIYLQSLGAIIFQYNTFAGLLIAIGLLISSRIAFSLSLLGFFTAYYFYQLTGAQISDLNYSYIGFNYILTSVAIGGFFLIPSAKSYLWSVLLIPVVALITISTASALGIFGLPVYALPFNMVVILFLYAVKFRVNRSEGVPEVIFQQNSPEKNLYAWSNDTTRFRHEIVPLRFPFFGTWSVSQGHEGDETHKGEWRHAWDFIIQDKSGSQFRGKGDFPEDYYCYGKPVTAAADGLIESVTDDISDNIIGEANIKENWGNTVVVRHNDYLYTSVSHLKPGSVPVKKGERVRTGDLLGKCGNSGRSPFPHLHFQVQTSPFVGAPTLNYSIANYIRHNEGKFELVSYGVPLKDELISNIEANRLLRDAFRFVPGRNIVWEAADGSQIKTEWEVQTSAYNYQYIKCLKTGAIAWFRFDESMFWFTHFTGSRDSLLFSFFLAAYKIPLGYYDGLQTADRLPVDTLFSGPLLWLQDFIAPFHLFLRPEYSLDSPGSAGDIEPLEINLKSTVVRNIYRKRLSEENFSLVVDEKGISRFVTGSDDDKMEYVRCG
jgi:urea transporter/murein DD-endopeptidase MepM/ murein hydrolase activator NlpD